MKRLITAYAASKELEKLIGYLVTRRSGLKLDQHHFDEIISHFEENGGHLHGIQGKLDDHKSVHYEKLHNSIDHILKKHKLKKKKG
jgi:hypothetical protein